MQNQTTKYTANDNLIFILTWGYLVSLNVIDNPLITSFALFGLTLLVLVFSNFRLEFYNFHLFTLQFCLFCYASAFWALNGRLSIEIGKSLLQTIICLSVFYAYYKKFTDVDMLLKIVMWAGYFVVFYTYFFYGVVDVVEAEDRLVSEFANVNSIAMLAAVVVTIHWYFFLFKKKSITFLMVIPCFIVIGAVQSRKAIVMSLLGIVLIYFFKQLRSHRNNLLPFLKVGFFLFFFILMVYLLAQTEMFSGLSTRMDGLIASVTGEGTADHSSRLREFYREIGWIQFSRTPMAGIGIGNAIILVARAADKNTYLHCNYAELAADGGILGLFSYYIMYLYILWYEFKYVRKDTTAVLIIVWIMVKLVADWGLVSYYTKASYFYLMIYFLHVNMLRKKYGKKRRWRTISS